MVPAASAVFPGSSFVRRKFISIPTSVNALLCFSFIPSGSSADPLCWIREIVTVAVAIAIAIVVVAFISGGIILVASVVDADKDDAVVNTLALAA